MWSQQHTLARGLHGPVQGAIVAAALRLDSAIRTDTLTDDLIQNSRDLILSSVAGLEDSTKTANFEEAMSLLTTMWQGVCRIEIDLPDSVRGVLDRDVDCAAATVDILTEACGNAVRHGGATTVMAQLSLVGDRELRIVVTDDGEPGPGDWPAGLGSRVLTALSLDWSIERGSHGTQLTTLLAVSPTP
jgi:signal transduction histidine kinase